MTNKRLASAFAIAFCSIAAVPMLIAAPATAKKQRVGGKVQRTWPQGGNRPDTALARWLARQVGPLCPPHSKSARKGKSKPKKCATLKGRPRGKRGKKTRSATAAKISGGDPSGYSRGLARIQQSEKQDADPIALTRSYEIPTDDPSYDRLLNWSWTYDSATAAAAFSTIGEKGQSARLLDQLAALQFKDGSIDIAFNVATGRGAGTYRSGTVAWLGLASASFDSTFASDRYLSTERRAAEYLLGLRDENGLIRGGPDVGWYSTQHNLLAYTLLERLGIELASYGDSDGAGRYLGAAAEISSSIDASLLYQDVDSAHFLQGYGDKAEALDTQTIGAMYLAGRQQPELAARVLAYAQDNFAVTDLSIVKSSRKATYNKTYSDKGPLSGFMPSHDGNSYPASFEGTATMRQATAALGQKTDALDIAAAEWREVTAKSAGAPLQANRTFTDADHELHVWPSAAAASWWLLAESSPGFFSPPLGK